MAFMVGHLGARLGGFYVVPGIKYVETGRRSADRLAGPRRDEVRKDKAGHGVHGRSFGSACGWFLRRARNQVRGDWPAVGRSAGRSSTGRRAQRQSGDPCDGSPLERWTAIC